MTTKQQSFNQLINYDLLNKVICYAIDLLESGEEKIIDYNNEQVIIRYTETLTGVYLNIILPDLDIHNKQINKSELINALKYERHVIHTINNYIRFK